VQPEQTTDVVVERFPPTSGRITGVIGLVTAAAVLVTALVARSAGTALGIAIAAALGGVLVWAALLRPSVAVTAHDLVLRSMFHTDRIPLAAIDRVVITQVLAVSAGGKRYVSPAIGHSVRQVARARRRPGGLEQQSLDELEGRAVAGAGRGAHQAYVEDRIAHLAQDSRDRLGVRKGSSEQSDLAAGVRRTWAWPEIVSAGVLTLALVVWLVL
jgi:hypothetical protein